MTWCNLDALLKVKMASLLHDPPWKAWVSAPCTRGPLLEQDREIKIREDTKAYEADAVALAEKVGLGNIVRDGVVRKQVKLADRFAAMFDRLLLSAEEELISSRVQMLNIFEPSKTLELTMPEEACISEFIRNLKKLLKPLLGKNLIHVYHVLWFAYEPLWYMCCRQQATSPADTRVPTHSVFDHVYATAMVSNVITANDREEPFDGYALVIDFAGVQKYISRSRKLRDLWASSWIASLLAWLAIEPFVKCLGPDVVVSPSLRGNWFYISWLLEKLRTLGVDASSAEDLAKKAYAYPGWPKHPLMPTRIVLLIPKISEPSSCRDGGEGCEELCRALSEGAKAVETFVRENVKEKWRRVIERILKDLWNLIEVSMELNEVDADLVKIAKAVKEITLRFPLPLRVVMISLNEVLSDYKEWVEKSELKNELEEVRDHWVLFYHYLMAVKVPALEALYKLSRVEPDAIDEWRDLGSIIRKTKFCTVCGAKPAVIAIPKGDKYQRFEEMIRKKRGSRPIEPGLISDGERLCPICAVKRLISFYYEEILKAIGLGNVPSSERIYLPSTYDVSNLGRILGPWSDEVLKIIERAVEENALHLLPGRFSIRRLDVGEIDAKLMRKVRHRCEEIASKYELDLGKMCAEAFKDLLGTVVEASISSDVLKELKSRLNELKNEHKKLADEISEPISGLIGKIKRSCSTRYVIVRGDGDNVGSGLHRGKLRLSAREYLKTIVEAVWGSANDNEAIKRWVNTYCRICSKLGVTIPLTPAYHYSISRALSIAAIRDALIIEKHRGFVIYVGGDDILAVCPTYLEIDGKEEFIPFRIVIDTRRNYWGEYSGAHNGFFLLTDPIRGKGPILAPAIRSYGRTYSVVVAHYRDPMMPAIKRSADLEEIGKESIATITVGSAVYGKTSSVSIGSLCSMSNSVVCRDRLVIEDTRSSLAASIPLRLRLLEGGDERIAELVEKCIHLEHLVRQGSISRSLFYDVRAHFVTEPTELAKRGLPDVLERLLHYVVSHNARRNIVSKVMDILRGIYRFADVYEDQELARRVLGLACRDEYIVPLALEILSTVLIMIKSRR